MNTPDLRKREWTEAISDRREQAGFKKPLPEDPAPDSNPDTEKAPPDDLVGLALSGGGLRSAAFNLGLIQALHKSGILRFVDYLSSVSGGSYIGAMASESVAHKKEYAENKFEIQPQRGGKQPDRVLNIAKRGNYLCRLDLLANRYMIGLVLNLIPRIALVIAVGAGIAFVWRLLDLHWVRDRLGGLGINDDVRPTLLPAVITLVIWLFLCGGALLLQSRPLKVWSNRIFWVTVLFFVISFTVIIGNGDITMIQQANEDLSENRIFWQEYVRKPLVVLTLIGLIPLLFPRRLLRSGTAPRGTIESWIFYYTSFTLFLGIPLIAVGWFARENISGFATHRGPDLVYGDVKDTSAFCNLIREPGLRVVVEHPYGDDDHDIENEVAFTFHPPRLRVKPFPQQFLSRLQIEHGETPVALDADYLHESVGHLNEIRTNLALDRTYPPTDDRGQPADRNPFSESLDDRWHVATASSDAHWLQWRYLSFVPRLQFCAYTVFGHPMNPYAKFVEWNSLVRLQESAILEQFNKHLRRGKIFEVESEADLKNGDDSSGFEHRIPEESIAGPIAELIRHAEEHDGQLADERQRAELNRFLLVQAFPEVFRPRSEIRRTTLIYPDQWHRLFWFLGASAVFLISSMLINPNATSLHDYYRDRLSVAFLKAGEKHGNEPYPKISHMQLCDCRPDKHGAPYPLFGAAVAESRPWWIHPDQLQPPFQSYLLSPLYSGVVPDSLGETKDVAEDELTVADAMAISAAALSPNYFVHHFVHHIVTAVMSILNLRMGKWLPRMGCDRSPPKKPTVLSLFWDDWRAHRKKHRRFTLVTDGGHAENLGLEVLLERRCRLIIVSDAGHDSAYGFDDLARLWRRYHAVTGVELLELQEESAPLRVADRLPRRPLRRNGVGTSKGNTHTEESVESLREILGLACGDCSHEGRHFFCARIRYPDDDVRGDGLLVYIKPCLTGDEDLDILNFALRNREFPHEPSSDQAFSFAQFEAYRRLGYHTGEDISMPWIGVPAAADRHESENRLWEPALPFDVSMLITRIANSDLQPASEVESTRSRVSELLGQVESGDYSVALQELERLGARSAVAAEKILAAAVAQPEAGFKELTRCWFEAGVRPLSRIIASAISDDREEVALEAIEVLEVQWKMDGVDIRTGVKVLCSALVDRDVLQSVRKRLLQFLSEVHREQARFRPIIVEACQRLRDREKSNSMLSKRADRLLNSEFSWEASPTT